jgi:hypothetical protein
MRLGAGSLRYIDILGRLAPWLLALCCYALPFILVMHFALELVEHVCWIVEGIVGLVRVQVHPLPAPSVPLPIQK